MKTLPDALGLSAKSLTEPGASLRPLSVAYSCSFRLVTCLLVSLSASGRAQADDSVSIAYGMMEEGRDKPRIIQPLTTEFRKADVCCESNRGFGYVVHVTGSAPYRHIAKLILPKKSGDPEVVVTREALEHNPKYFCVHLEESDPAGVYLVEVHVNGRLEKTIEFTVNP